MSKLGVLFLALLCIGGGVVAAAARPRDRDRDRLPDRWERQHGLSTSKKSATRDPDGDQLRNRQEFRLHLNPRRRDTDSDGLGDRSEIRRFKTNPRKADTDGDGVRDGTEVQTGTNPRRKDSDGDGYTDRNEIKAGTDPADPTSYPGAPSPTPTPEPPGGDQFPNPASTGVPAGWTPVQTRSTSLTVTTPGAVVQDILFTNGADISVRAPNVTIRRVKLEDGMIENFYNGNTCGNGMVVEDTTIGLSPGLTVDPNGDHWVLGSGGYTARRVEVLDRSDGLRVGAREFCGPVTVEDSYIYVSCDGMNGPGDSWHTDGIQAYGGAALRMTNNTIDYRHDGPACGTSPFFYPNQGNDRADVDRLLLVGNAGYMFRLGTPGTVRDMRIEDKSWIFGPILNACQRITEWQASIVAEGVSRAPNGFRSTPIIRAQPCNTIDEG